MKITLRLSPEQELRLREGTTRRDANAVRRVLLRAVDSTVEELLRQPTNSTPGSDFETVADRLAESFAVTTLANHRPLPDEAVTREGIYDDHP